MQSILFMEFYTNFWQANGIYIVFIIAWLADIFRFSAPAIGQSAALSKDEYNEYVFWYNIPRFNG